MRWFWALIVALVVLTGGLYANRVRAHTNPTQASAQEEPTTPQRIVPMAQPVEQSEAHPQPPIEQPVTEPVTEPIAEPIAELIIKPVEPAVAQTSEAPILAQPTTPSAPIEVTKAEPIEEPTPEPADQPIAMPKPVVAQATPEQPIEKPTASAPPPETITQPAPKADPNPTPPPPALVNAPAPSYERLADGSFKILSTNEHIVGSGTAKDPFVLQWDLLSSVEREYNPKKGKEKLPDWLDLLDGQRVRIEGNSLVPVIATSTKELLVMQNPWDGCCVGVPPTPYDAIEVTLNQDVDFGSSATGYGHVEGTFVLDPYVVDGWVLGLYIIEDAQYRSGEGIEFSDF